MPTRRPKAPRKEPTQERAKETIRILLDAADLIVREKGAADASIAAIAEKAGVAQGSVYQYFPTKAAVLAAWEEREWQRLAEEMGTELAAMVEEKPPMEEAVRHLVRFAAQRIARQSLVYAGNDSAFPEFVSRGTERNRLIDGAIGAIAMVIDGMPEEDRARLRVKDGQRAAHVIIRLMLIVPPLASRPTFTPAQHEAVLVDLEELVLGYLFGSPMSAGNAG